MQNSELKERYQYGASLVSRYPVLAKSVEYDIINGNANYTGKYGDLHRAFHAGVAAALFGVDLTPNHDRASPTRDEMCRVIAARIASEADHETLVESYAHEWSQHIDQCWKQKEIEDRYYSITQGDSK